MARLRRGEVRCTGFRDPTKRPVDSVVEFLAEVTIAPITSTVRGIPSEVLLTHADGMGRECAVNLEHLQTVAKSGIGSLITTLTGEKLDQVAAAVSFALDLR